MFNKLSWDNDYETGKNRSLPQNIYTKELQMNLKIY